MKYALIIILLLSTSVGHAQISPDTVITNRLARLIRVNTEANKALNKLVVKTDSLKKAHVIKAAAMPEKNRFVRWSFILLPVLLFLIFTWYFMRWLKRDRFKLSDALSADMTDDQVQELQQVAMVRAAQGAAQDVPEPVLKRSSSRFIAFLSGLAAVIIAQCIVSYYMYFAINGLPIPKFEDLWTILAALGIGVVPYASKVMSEGRAAAPLITQPNIIELITLKT